MKLPIILLLTTLTAASAETEDVHVCACEAEEFGFDIDCANTDAMLDALSFLKTNGCASDCSSADCEKNYLIMQSHHDYCPEDGIPEEVEDGFHDYDETCTSCSISRVKVEGAPDCPPHNCDDNSGNAAFSALLDAGCVSDCSSATCRDNFLTLRVTHDVCDHDTLTRASEEGLHDLEVPCAAQICNYAGAVDSQLVCDDHDHDHDDHDDHGDDHDDHKDELQGASGAAAAAATGAAAVLIGATFMIA